MDAVTTTPNHNVPIYIPGFHVYPMGMSCMGLWEHKGHVHLRKSALTSFGGSATIIGVDRLNVIRKKAP